MDFHASAVHSRLLPKFGSAALMALNFPAVQRSTTSLLEISSRKTVPNVLGTLFADLGQLVQPMRLR